jgi:hypothetical protein
MLSTLQFFGNSTATAMEMYEKEGVEELQDCEPTVSFIRRVNDLVDVMHVKTPENALEKGGHGEIVSVIKL